MHGPSCKLHVPSMLNAVKCMHNACILHVRGMSGAGQLVQKYLKWCKTHASASKTHVK